MNKILFVEDDAPTQKIYRDKFSPTYDVLVAGTGAEGVQLAVKQKPDIIILDIILGGAMNGFDVLREIKLHPETKNIPVVVLTNLESQEQTAQDRGANECFIKANISIDTIGEIIKKYLPR